MALAYCILAHKNPAQLARLLRAIWAPENTYVLHYERRGPQEEHAAVARLASDFDNVRVLRARAVQWGRFSQVAVQLEALGAAMQSSAAWTHWINLTGQDFPLTPPSAIASELVAAPDASWVSSFDPFDGIHWKNTSDRLSRMHIDSSLLEEVLRMPGIGRRVRHFLGWTNRMPFVPFVRRKLPSGFSYIGGSNHVILSREAASYVLFDRRAQHTIGWLKWTGHPDETLYQTLLLNSPLREKIINDDRRAIFWTNAGDPSPRTLVLEDLDQLRTARDAGKLFGRKFDPAVDEQLICALETDLMVHSESKS